MEFALSAKNCLILALSAKLCRSDESAIELGYFSLSAKLCRFWRPLIAVSHNKPFNPNEHLMQLKSKEGPKDYLPVQWRLVWYRERCPEGTIETEMIHFDPDRETTEDGYAWNEQTRRSEKITKRGLGFCIFKATITDGHGASAIAYKSEKAASFPDYIEKCETGAVGRALAMLGYGTQFTGDELDEQHRIVDSPVKR